MDPVRLKPAVELPVRRARPLALGVGLALLFAFGARNYVASMRHCPYARVAQQTVRLDLASDPPGATVVRERDGRRMCTTPCVVNVEAIPSLAIYRFELDGHESRRQAVNLAGGDSQVEVVLQPERAVYYRVHNVDKSR